MCRLDFDNGSIVIQSRSIVVGQLVSFSSVLVPQQVRFAPARLKPVLTVVAASSILVACAGDDGGVVDEQVAKGNATEIRSEAVVELKTAETEEPADDLSNAALKATNAARAAGQRCGDEDFEPAPPVKWQPQVAHAALMESEYMQQNNTFGHAWADGTRVGDRLTMAGYDWRMADENIAAGFGTLDKAIQAWIDSPPHCRALMRPDLTVVGIAVVPGTKENTYNAYWTMVLARPMESQR
ncbi:MAG: CAP domain-containing protein [Burkholderiaceae bacterium]